MKKKTPEAVFSWLGDHCHHVSGIRQTYAGLLLLKPRRLAQAAVWEHERLCGMSRRTGSNSGPHCQGSWQWTPIVGQGKEFSYIFQQGPQLQTNQSNRLLRKPFCPHSNPHHHRCCSADAGLTQEHLKRTQKEAKEGKYGAKECGATPNWSFSDEIQPRAGLGMLAVDSLIWTQSLENKACFVFSYCSHSLSSISLCKDALGSVWDVKRKQRPSKNNRFPKISRLQFSLGLTHHAITVTWSTQQTG